MRLLFLSNLYPPADRGGYEQICAEVAEGLGDRGHEVWTLTSVYKKDEIGETQARVVRELHLESDIDYYQPLSFITRWKKNENSNQWWLRHTIETVSPDLLVVWGMWNLSFSLAAAAETSLPGRVAYYIASYWPTDIDMHHMYWSAPANRIWTELAKRPVRAWALSRLRRAGYPPGLRLRRAQCISHYVRERLVDAGKLSERAGVIPCGIDPGPFIGKERMFPEPRTDQLRLLYFGSLLPHKGVHTSIEALDKARGRTDALLELTILGSGHSAYERELKQMVDRLGLANVVHFIEQVPREEVPRVLHEHDVFLFTSTWAEPLGRTILEAMAAGLVVIGADVGGSREILDLYSDDLRFAAEDADTLADKILMVSADGALRAELVRKGQELVDAKFTLGRTIDRLEEWFASIR